MRNVENRHGNAQAVSAAPVADWGILTEEERVLTWRLCRLLELGYELPAAEDIARTKIDLHELEQLVTRSGCPLDLAEQILR
jgi:hypothetical protein